MEKDYQVVDSSSKLGSRELAEFLSKEGQLLLPLLDLVTQGQRAIDEVIDVMGRATIEAILKMSAEEVAGKRQQGKASDRPYYWHGTQPGRVALAERQLRVDKPRLRKRKSAPGEQAEVEIPAYEALRKDQRLADRVLSILMRGVSTRNYREVLPEMAEQVGVSKSQVSRENIDAGERLLKELTERDFSQHDLLIIYIDGLRFGDYVVVAAVGVDVSGQKHVLALREGATENAEVAKSLLEELVARGVKPGRRRLFVIDGAKALRTAIDQVYGANQPVQRCRQAQAPQRAGPPPQRPARPGPLHAQGRLEAGSPGRDGQTAAICRVAGSPVAQRRRQHPRRAGGDVHGQSPGLAGCFAALPGHDEPDRLHQ
jgi:hypothetical protein